MLKKIIVSKLIKKNSLYQRLKAYICVKGSKLILKVEEVPDHQLVREGEKKAAEVIFFSHLKLDTFFIKNNKMGRRKMSKRMEMKLSSSSYYTLLF